MERVLPRCRERTLELSCDLGKLLEFTFWDFEEGKLSKGRGGGEKAKNLGGEIASNGCITEIRKLIVEYFKKKVASTKWSPGLA